MEAPDPEDRLRQREFWLLVGALFGFALACVAVCALAIVVFR